MFCGFCFNDTATTEIYTYLHTLSLHDALPISKVRTSPSASGEPARSNARSMTSVSVESNDPLRCPRPSNDRDNRASVGGGGGGSGPSSIASAMSAQRRRAETVSVMSASHRPGTSWASSPRNRSTWRVFTFATTTRIWPDESRPCSQAWDVRGSDRASRDVLRSWEASPWDMRSEEHTSELQSLMRNAYAVIC